jgi:hypothetical protein
MFRDPHPRRHKQQPRSGDSVMRPLLDSDFAIEGLCLAAKSAQKLKVFVISRTMLGQFAVQPHTFEVSKVSKRKVFAELLRVVPFEHCFVAQLKDESWIQLHGDSEVRLKCDRQIVSVAASGEWVSLSSSDFITSIFSIYQPAPVWEFRSYQGPIRCSAISETFKVHIAGTSEGSLDITSLSTGESIQVIMLENVTPMQLFITKTWGFILGYVSQIVDGSMQYSLVVHTVNGEFVRKKTINDAIHHAVTFCSPGGFDYFGFLTKRGLFVCEVFYLDIKQLNGTVATGAKCFQYSSEIEAFIIIDVARNATCVPYVPDDFAAMKEKS